MNAGRTSAGAVSNDTEGKTDIVGGRALRRPSRPVLHDPSKPPRRIGAVAFGTAEIFEHEVGYMESPTSGAPRLHQGKMVNHSLRRLDSLESEREPIRHHRESIQPLTPDERRDLATVGREMFAETVAAAAPVKAPPTSVDAVLDNWHLGADGSIYHNGGVTSKVTNVDGRVVTTAAHGSRYRLETLKPALRDVLTRLSIAFDPETPLANPASLLYAFTVTKLTPEKQDCVVLVRALEDKLKAFGPSVRDCFATIDKAFLALGFPE